MKRNYDYEEKPFYAMRERIKGYAVLGAIYAAIVGVFFLVKYLFNLN